MNQVKICRVQKVLSHRFLFLHQHAISMEPLIEQACKLCYENNRLTKLDTAARDKVRLVLQQYFQCNTGNALVQVHSFGSTINGYGFRKSDLDFYVGGISFKEAYNVLKRNNGFTHVRAINCRVPIISFYHKNSRLRGDLSFQNSIGLQNSKLLRRYASISLKGRHVVYTFKHMAKTCKIADAWHNFLSSYTLTIMAIHYLQQLEQPVLPLLQKIKPLNFTDEDNIKNVVDGYDTYYFSGNNQALELLWPDFDKNQQSVAELFVGLLRYYGEEFDFAKHAICIHKLEKPEILKNKKRMVILDPFENERDLGVPLTKSSSILMQSVFSNAYSHFSSVRTKPFNPNILLKYFFNPKVLLGDHYKKHWYFSKIK